MSATPSAADLPAFKMVRGGYDPVQVNQYLARPALQRGPAPEFATLRRGYDPAEVDRFIRGLHNEDPAQRR